jgi:DMSO/TMAO reductase YedYZ molybdopterin-dependent catalytic subunit
MTSPLDPTPPDAPTVNERIPPGQQLVATGKWPVIGEREPAQSDAPWTLKISGLVANPIEYSLEDLRAFPQTTTTLDIHCVTRWSKLDVQFSGVLLKDLLSFAQPADHAQFVSFVARSSRKHSTSLKIVDASNLGTLIALDVEGAPIPVGHGGPLRNIMGGRYFYKSVKWLEEIAVLEKDRLGFWEAESGYHNLADPWTEQRYMVPTIDRRKSIQLIASRNFSDQDLRSIDATERDLSGLKASNASLRDANFTRAILTKADFSNANLSNAHFHHANLAGANFKGADVEGADFSGANLNGVDFTDCSAIGASFFVEHEGQRTEAIIDESTTLPDAVIAPLFPAQLAFVKQKLGRS